jgi:uncharacterized SAM-binding protein YcdF (DUF218 family)
MLTFLYGTDFLPKQLIGNLEWSYPPLTDSIVTNDSLFIVVMGAGCAYDPRWPASLHRLSPTQSVRLTEGVRMMNMYKNAIMVTSGRFTKSPVSQAEITKQAAIELGISPQRIQVQHNPRTTCEEVADFVNAHGTDDDLIVVTSAIHMRRAMQLFRRAGLNPIPAPCDYTFAQNPYVTLKWGDFIPSLTRVKLLDQWAKEVMAYHMGSLSKQFNQSLSIP